MAYIQKPLDLELLYTLIDRAFDPGQGMRLELSGITLAEIVKIYALKRADIVLRFLAKSCCGIVAVERGVICHAQLGELSGAEALLTMLACPAAVVCPMHAQLPAQRSLSLSWFALSAACETSSAAQRLALLRTTYPVPRAQPVLRTFDESLLSSPDRSIEELVTSFKAKRLQRLRPEQ
jgi:hypothetical protein